MADRRNVALTNSLKISRARKHGPHSMLEVGRTRPRFKLHLYGSYDLVKEVAIEEVY